MWIQLSVYNCKIATFFSLLILDLLKKKYLKASLNKISSLTNRILQNFLYRFKILNLTYSSFETLTSAAILELDLDFSKLAREAFLSRLVLLAAAGRSRLVLRPEADRSRLVPLRLADASLLWSGSRLLKQRLILELTR